MPISTWRKQPRMLAAAVDRTMGPAGEGDGMGLIPTIVGSNRRIASTTLRGRDSARCVLQNQGREEAGIAVTDAGNLGLGPGTILYYDMERYDETAQTPGCRIASTAFLKG